jgi:hypothetical protein
MSSAFERFPRRAGNLRDVDYVILGIYLKGSFDLCLGWETVASLSACQCVANERTNN